MNIFNNNKKRLRFLVCREGHIFQSSKKLLQECGFCLFVFYQGNPQFECIKAEFWRWTLLGNFQEKKFYSFLFVCLVLTKESLNLSALKQKFVDEIQQSNGILKNPNHENVPLAHRSSTFYLKLSHMWILYIQVYTLGTSHHHKYIISTSLQIWNFSKSLHRRGF